MEDKTMKKVFGIAALLLALAACNKETEITPVEQPSDSKGITITATLAPKTADTKAVADKGDNKITVTWAVNEHIAILYDKDGAQVADATITAVNGTTGAATIEFTVVSGTADNTLKVLPDDAARGSLASYTTLGSTAVSNWAVAQKSDYEAIFTNLGSTKSDEDGYTYDDNVNAYITTGVGGTALSGIYWSATGGNGESYAWRFDSDYWDYRPKQASNNVRPVLAF